MRVEYVYPSGERISLDNNIDNYLLPIVARIELSDIPQNHIYIDSKAVDVVNGSLSLAYAGEDKLIECGEEKFRINSLVEPQSEKFKIEYHEFAERLYKIYDKNYTLDENTLFSAIDCNDKDNGINLCTFNRNIEDIDRDTLLESIFDYVKYLSAVFYRPKIHLRADSEVRPVDTVVRIGHESIKHLASHSEHWEARKANGLVPARLLARILEDNYAIYENIAAKCLVDKLYKYVLQKRDELKNITMQMPTEESFITVNSEQKSYFQAIKVLLKGYSNYEIEIVGKLLEEQITQVDYIISKLSECRSTALYRKLKHCQTITGALMPTNIFMMDNNYKYVYKLWKLYSEGEKTIDDIEIDEVSREYELYCQVMLLFALNNFNFEREKRNITIFADGKLCDGKYEFFSGGWEVNISETEISSLGINNDINGVIIEISKKLEHKVDISNIEVPFDEDLAQIDFVRKEGKYFIFNRYPSDDEIASFCDMIRKKAKGDRGKEKKLYGDLKKAIAESFIGFKRKVCNVLLIPLPFKFLDSSINAKRCMDNLDKQIIQTVKDKIIDACYYLTPFRPTDYSEKENDQQVKLFLNYGYADKDTHASSLPIRRGLLPITVNDINSYRRITKVLLMHLLQIDDELKICPICGETFSFDGDNGYYCRSCSFTVYKTVCKKSKCKKHFSFTRYPLPKPSTVKCDTLNINLLKDEVESGFKNITAMEADKPICPYCGDFMR